MENAAEMGDPRRPLRGHRRTGQRAHTERRHPLVPRGGRALISVRDSREDTKRDPRPSKPGVAGSNPAGRANFQENSPIVPSAWTPGAKVQAKKVTGPLPRLAD